MRLLALDIGEKRIGLALSESGIFATPHSVLHRKSKQEDFARLQQLIETLHIERLIIGMPYSVSGQEQMGPQARRVKRYADALATVITTPITFFDESYSTVDAAAKLADANLSDAKLSGAKRTAASKKKTPIDAAAAAVILQNYINAGNL